MSIFKEAARLAEESPRVCAAEWEGMAEWMSCASDFLRTIAAMDVEVEPDAYRYTASKSWPDGKWHYQKTFPTWDNRAVVEIGDMEALYTQESLDAAILKAHDAAIESAAQVADQIGDDKHRLYKGRAPYYGTEDGRADPYTNGLSDGAGLAAEAIRALKGQP